VSQWVFLIAVVVATAILVGGLVERSDRLAEAERAARIELALANALLETRVADQVDQLARLDRLRRFLSTDVAEAVMSAGPAELLQPHRRAIAVLFCDLRGFTRFTSDAEPEEVVELLGEYYDVVAEVLARHHASIGSFAGDGILAYVGDPGGVEDPVGIALDAASGLRAPLEQLLSRWSDRGFELGHGVGIAYGFATLGMIGTVDRCDYTPLGSVVNLAARLCTEAKDGEIILDGRARAALAGRVRTEGARFVLKGFGEVEAHRVLEPASEATIVPLRAALA
jgi:adenylate cyclase